MYGCSDDAVCYSLYMLPCQGQRPPPSGVLTLRDVKGRQKLGKAWKKHYCFVRDGWIIINKDTKNLQKVNSKSYFLTKKTTA